MSSLLSWSPVDPVEVTCLYADRHRWQPHSNSVRAALAQFAAAYSCGVRSHGRSARQGAARCVRTSRLRSAGQAWANGPWQRESLAAW